MGDTVQVVGSVEKLSTYSAKGGGLSVVMQMEDDPRVAAMIIANRQKIADITFSFRATMKSKLGDDKSQAKLIDDDGEFVNPDDTEEMP